MNALRLVSAVRNGFAHSFKAPQKLIPFFYSNKVQVRLQSSQPVPAGRLPCRVKVQAGKRYAWCACGHSKKQPFCDGAHKASAPDIAPLRFAPDKDQTMLLCACKRTRNAPYCDGSHFTVIFRDVVKSVERFFFVSLFFISSLYVFLSYLIVFCFFCACFFVTYFSK